MSTLKTISMREAIERHYQGTMGYGWFGQREMRFFRTTLPQRATIGVDGFVYFVTGEKGPSGPRAYSVRRIVGPQDIETSGRGFMAYPTLAKAEDALDRIASGAVGVADLPSASRGAEIHNAPVVPS